MTGKLDKHYDKLVFFFFIIIFTDLIVNVLGGSDCTQSVPTDRKSAAEYEIEAVVHSTSICLNLVPLGNFLSPFGHVFSMSYIQASVCFLFFLGFFLILHWIPVNVSAMLYRP